MLYSSTPFLDFSKSGVILHQLYSPSVFIFSGKQKANGHRNCYSAAEVEISPLFMLERDVLRWKVWWMWDALPLRCLKLGRPKKIFNRFDGAYLKTTVGVFGDSGFHMNH